MKNDNKRQKNSLFLYTALIFIAAIIIVLIAFFAQSHVNNSQPSISPAVSAASKTPLPASSALPLSKPQGIAKTAAQLSSDNLELLEENRELSKEIEALKAENNAHKKLIEAYNIYLVGDNTRAKILFSEIDKEKLSAYAKSLYDVLASNLQ